MNQRIFLLIGHCKSLHRRIIVNGNRLVSSGHNLTVHRFVIPLSSACETYTFISASVCLNYKVLGFYLVYLTETYVHY